MADLASQSKGFCTKTLSVKSFEECDADGSRFCARCFIGFAAGTRETEDGRASPSPSKHESPVRKETTPVWRSIVSVCTVLPCSSEMEKHSGSGETPMLNLPHFTACVCSCPRHLAIGNPQDFCARDPLLGIGKGSPLLSGKTLSRNVCALTGEIWISTSE